MGERHMVSVEAVRRWLTFANVSEYQRAALRSLCDAAAERDKLRGEREKWRRLRAWIDPQTVGSHGYQKTQDYEAGFRAAMIAVASQMDAPPAGWEGEE